VSLLQPATWSLFGRDPIDEVFRKISQIFSPADVTARFVARAMPMDSDSVVPVTER
jgi:hypothetical protein